MHLTVSLNLVHQEVELKIISIADRIQLERPFQAVFKLSSKVDRQLGPLTLAMASGDTSCHVHMRHSRCHLILHHLFGVLHLSM